MFKNFIERMFGVDELRKKAEEEAKLAAKQLEEAKAYAEKRKKEEELEKMSPKERATAQGEPWVAVLDTKVNAENPRNGFFELDWNEHFIIQLKTAGYKGETDEEIVDEWFRSLCRNIGQEENLDMEKRGAGYINVHNIGEGRSEIS